MNGMKAEESKGSNGRENKEILRNVANIRTRRNTMMVVVASQCLIRLFFFGVAGLRCPLEREASRFEVEARGTGSSLSSLSSSSSEALRFKALEMADFDAAEPESFLE